MTEEPKARVYPRGLGDEFPHGPPTVVITHRGCRFVLRFAEGDLAGEGELQRLEVLPLDSDTLEPRALRQFAPVTELYVAYARAGMRLLGAGPLDEGDPEADWELRTADVRGASEALRQVGGPGRGLGEPFFRLIARHYTALVSEGERHPVKAIGEIHHVTTSAASRWVTEAKRRGLVPKEAGDA